ncbi:hypothetical protein AB0E55_22905 [Amycolatopsis keratiniphila]|uniref:hypothetical protein n=1 Tax=Amycolatopsis keratiniphila TaxID=129921 RepID=UPI0033EF9A8F
MSRKDRSPACSRVAGDSTTSPVRGGTVIVIVLVFGFEVYLLHAGYDVVTTLVLAAAGVVISGTAGRPAVLRGLVAHLPIQPGVIAHG